jgi:type IV secretory pathway component VirB8
VRFEKTVRARNAPEDQSRVSKWIATIGYDYKKIAKMKESERLKNPLGFNVDSYRTDPEMLEMPAAPKGESGSSQTPVVPAIAPQGAAK